MNLEDEDSAFSDNKPMSVLTSRSEDPDVQLSVVLLYRRASFYGALLFVLHRYDFYNVKARLSTSEQIRLSLWRSFILVV